MAETGEIAMMFLCPYVSYLIAEGLQLSGIVAILTNGVFLNYYATPNISNTSRKIASLTYETIAYGAETVVFLFLGIGLFAFAHPFKEMGVGLFLTTVLNLNFSRFLNVRFCTWCANLTRSEPSKIKPKTEFVIWFAGLRGAMAYALALSCAKDFPTVGPIILIDTLLYSFLTILIQGSVMNPVVLKCNVKQKVLGIEPEARDTCCNRFKQRFRIFDTNYFSPLFIKTTQKIRNRNNSIVSLAGFDRRNSAIETDFTSIDPTQFSLNEKTE